MKQILLVTMVALGFTFGLNAQAIYEDERYVPETDPLVLQKLDQWQNIKFGLLMHWGAYSQWGIVESWSLCPEDYGWCERKKGDHYNNYFEYKKDYENLQKTFNPVDFNPQKWAKAAKDAGMRYVVFTTKHHDGFCMFDSKFTDYKVTSEQCPFHTNPKANIAKEVFDAFRAEGLWAGAYFSKPDWHCPSYWDPYFPPLDRNVNYDPEEYPEEWEKYVQFTHNQIDELMTDYGKIDILWLDGGWVAKTSEEEIKEYYKHKGEQTKSGFVKNRIVNQDIRMDEIAAKAREKQPGLIVVDRAVHGKNQNYLTPENRVPNKTLPYPWESCIISGGGWSYTFNAKYKSGNECVHMLVDIVAKGGNLLLNIAPGPDGKWQQGAYDLLNEYADWMKVNSEAIYNTKPIEPFKENNICMTQKDDGSVYFHYMAEEGEAMPAEIKIESIELVKSTKLRLLGSKKKLSWKKANKGFVVTIPEDIRNAPPCKHVWVIKANKIVR
ncbi:alpha-L-fucosidase [Carboxylicivirga sp. A043]|uniref:alpha-L-fucosidase n=1 Tax=Carboxylicivirga litoralis TaxID=2816963 RepID=UPI0021CB7BFB|nr:alpha-L-fucosidase [Carboxylicivirga sp. A043]MCU4156541.1 alpha-L-fucosidase [Carboxylicivirga sp. A043]